MIIRMFWAWMLVRSLAIRIIHEGLALGSLMICRIVDDYLVI